MPCRDSMPVERSTVSAIVDARAMPGGGDVDELVLTDTVVDHGQAPGGDETA